MAPLVYDENCWLLSTLYPTAVYLPPETTAATYDEDTNPTSVELEIFAPYGISYDAEEQYKENCTVPCNSRCGAGIGAGDDTTVLPGIGGGTAAVTGNTGGTENTES